MADYDGTLTQLQSVPQLATPSPYITNLLDSLSKVGTCLCGCVVDVWVGANSFGTSADVSLCVCVRVCT